jgi:hypothetical protein
MINLFDPTGDPEHVANMIYKYLETDNSYQFRRHVLTNFTWQSIVENKIIPLLQESGTTANDKQQ